MHRQTIAKWLTIFTLTISSLCVAIPFALAADTPIGLVPRLNVSVPNLQFATVSKSNTGQLEVPYLAQYVSAAYNFLLGASLIAAAVMIVYGGFLYLLGGTIGSIEKGKSIIQDAIVGLVLIFGTYTILATLNPATTRLTTIKVQNVQGADMEWMEKFFGFVDSESQKISLAGGENAPTGGTGAAPPPGTGEDIVVETTDQSGNADGLGESGAQLGGRVDISSIDISGKPSEALSRFCTDPNQMKGADIGQKYAALVKALLGFAKVCNRPDSCAYVRTGFTDLRSGKVTAGGSDTPFLLKNIQLLTNHSGPGWVDSCTGRYARDIEITKPDGSKDTVPGPGINTDNFYKYRKDPALKDFEFPSGECYKQLQEVYQKEFVDQLTERGIFGGDCGSTIAQIYSCSGGQIADSFINLIPWFGKPRSSYHVALGAKNESDLKNQIKQSGGLRFGDVVIVGDGNKQHNFIYTGGRSDVPFAIFEMGGAGEPNTGARTTLQGGKTVGGVRIRPKNPAGDPLSLFDYIHAHESIWYPITIVRPFQFKSCTSKTECSNDEACQCTLADVLTSRGLNSKMLLENSCSLHDMCHREVNAKNISRTAGKCGCTSDEQCKNGETCGGDNPKWKCCKAN